METTVLRWQTSTAPLTRSKNGVYVRRYFDVLRRPNFCRRMSERRRFERDNVVHFVIEIEQVKSRQNGQINRKVQEEERGELRRVLGQGRRRLHAQEGGHSFNADDGNFGKTESSRLSRRNNSLTVGLLLCSFDCIWWWGYYSRSAFTTDSFPWNVHDIKYLIMELFS